MIRGIGRTETGAPLVIVGLTKENVELLKEGRPIRARYPDGSYVIVIYGENAESIQDDLRSLGLLPPAPPPQINGSTQ